MQPAEGQGALPAEALAPAVARLVEVYADIAATRMAGLPINNPALQVEAVGFVDWQGALVGVLIAPWAINLIILPGRCEAFRALGIDQKQAWAFPSGEYEFMGGADDRLGAYQCCSLFSPVLEFATQAEARLAAATIMDALLAVPLESAEVTAAQAEAARLNGQPLLEQPLSRRGFLRGGFLGKTGGQGQ